MNLNIKSIFNIKSILNLLKYENKFIDKQFCNIINKTKMKNEILKFIKYRFNIVIDNNKQIYFCANDKLNLLTF